MEERVLKAGGLMAGVAPGAASSPASVAATGVSVGRPAGSIGFAWAMIALTGWGVFASYFDGWAHNRNKADSFFTVWHADLYLSLFVVAICLGVAQAYYHRKGYAWANALPPGFEISALGVGGFAVGGFLDMIWHITLGIEPGSEALVSPPHFLLAASGTLIILGPLVWAWQRSDAAVPAPPWMDRLLLSIPIAYVLSMLTFMTQFYHPFGRTGTASDYFTRTDLTTEVAPFTLEVASIVIQSALLVTLLLLFVRHARLRPGSLTIIFGINGALMVFMKANRLATGPLPLFAVMLLAGVAADVLLWKLRPVSTRLLAVRMFAFLVPFILYALYFTAIKLAGGGIVVSVHVWTGSILLAGITGCLASFAVMPPRMLAAGDQPAPATPGDGR